VHLASCRHERLGRGSPGCAADFLSRGCCQTGGPPAVHCMWWWWQMVVVCGAAVKAVQDQQVHEEQATAHGQSRGGTVLHLMQFMPVLCFRDCKHGWREPTESGRQWSCSRLIGSFRLTFVVPWPLEPLLLRNQTGTEHVPYWFCFLC
jgi:hypothetical protein